MSAFVYIVTNRRRGTLYVGVISNLPQRIGQHKSGDFGGFTKRHGLKHLVWFERHDAMEAAIVREKQIKRWLRAWKVKMIEAQNPQWEDLFDRIANN